MAPSVSCDRKCMCQKLKCPSNAIYKPHMPISSYAHETTMSVYMPYMSSMQSTMWPGTLAYIHFTLLAYDLVTLCLSHCTYMSHYTSTVVYIVTPYYCICKSKNPETFNYHNIAMNVPTRNVLQMPQMPINSCAHERNKSIYMPHMSSLQSTMWPETDIHTFQLLAYVPNIYACYCTYIYCNTPTVVFIQTPYYCTYK